MLVPDTSAADLLLPSKRRNVAQAVTSDRQSVLWERSCTWLSWIEHTDRPRGCAHWNESDDFCSKRRPLPFGSVLDDGRGARNQVIGVEALDEYSH